MVKLYDWCRRQKIQSWVHQREWSRVQQGDAALTIILALLPTHDGLRDTHTHKKSELRYEFSKGPSVFDILNPNATSVVNQEYMFLIRCLSMNPQRVCGCIFVYCSLLC